MLTDVKEKGAERGGSGVEMSTGGASVGGSANAGALAKVRRDGKAMVRRGRHAGAATGVTCFLRSIFQEIREKQKVRDKGK